MKKKTITRQHISMQGFTLVELAIYLGLFSIIIVILMQMYIGILDMQLSSKANSEVDIDSKFIYQRLLYDISQASAITTPAPLGSSSTTLSIMINGIPTTYSLSGSNLQLTNATGSNTLNSNQTTISNLSFQKIGNSGGKETVRVQFTVTSATQRRNGNETKTIQTTIGRR